MSGSAFELIDRLSRESDFTAQLRARAAERSARIVLPESDDERVLQAAIALAHTGVARPILIGSREPTRRRLQAAGSAEIDIEIVDPESDDRRARVAERLFERRRAKGLSQGEASVLAGDPVQLGAGLVAMGHAEGMVAGAAHATGDVIRAGLYHAGLAEGIRVASGCFLMVPPAGHPIGWPLLFADSAVIPAPDEEQLVSIGMASAITYRRLTGEEPRIACLSFSTKGSADHPRAAMMARVADALRAKGLQADGELQLDAALIAAVGQRKAAGSAVAGRAQVLLFPDLDAGNIGYKIAQRLGGFSAVGPIVQGLAKPIFDLSRGCSAADVVNTAAIAALAAEEKP